MSTLVAITITAIVLLWLLADGTGETLVTAFVTASPLPLMLGGLLAIGIQIIRAWRFGILATGSLSLPSWTMIAIATKLVLFNFLLPFKLGELSFPLMMKRAYSTPFGQGAGILVLCRLLDLGVVAAFILLTSAWLLDSGILGWNATWIHAFGIIALLTPILIVDQLPRWLPLAAAWPRIHHLAGQLSHGASMMRPLRQRALVATLTLSVWFAHAVIAWFVAQAIGAGIGLAAITMASAASNLAFALPVSGVAGLGPPQAAWASMLHLAGHAWTPAIASALLCHGLLLVTLSLFGAVIWLSDIIMGKPRVDDPSAASSIDQG